MDIAQTIALMEDQELAAYKLLVTTGGATTDRLATSLGWKRGRAAHVLSGLRRMKLARSHGEERNEEGGEWTAVHPEAVKLQYARPLVGALDAWQEQLDGMRKQVEALTELSDGASHDASASPVATLDGAQEICDALTVCARRCSEEILAVQPLGTGVPEAACAVLDRDAAHVTEADVRVLLPHLSRYDAGTRQWAEGLADAGGEVRTSASPLPALIVFDRTVVVLLDGQDAGTAHLVKHGAMVELIVNMIMNAWATGAPFQGTGGSNRIPDSLTQETKTEILKLLAAGYKDEVVARRLGIGVRTCRKYIAEIFGELGAQSRFQAGWLVRDRLLGADSAPATAEGLRRADTSPTAPATPGRSAS
ncbi:helix-turn-helix transcriptional regulator [Streptomyces sp. NBC_00388]|uniref:helix-turn-helix transcriptional regulator n=1 Tax=Streptomyces sp. NBC_00388 TaxID=2975735 RepID=UPI002E20B542